MNPPESPSVHPSTLAQQTLARIQEAMTSGANQCLPELMEIIHALSAKATEISIEQLADLIEKHVAVMARVISAANTFGYNPSGTDITNVRDAIHVIGFERIRSLVTSLILVRHAADGSDTRDQRSTALLAVSSGLMARTIAAERDLADPELAFVAASLRQLGRLLLVAYMPDEYRAAVARSKEIPEAKAFEEIFGMSPLAITRAVLAQAHFPDRLLDALQEHQPKPTTRRSIEAQALIGLSSFSEQLCKLSMDRNQDEAGFAKAAEELCRTHGNKLAFDKEQLENTLASMGDLLAQFTNTMGFGNVAQDVVGTMRWRAGRGPSTALPKNPPPPATGQTKQAKASDSPTANASTAAQQAQANGKPPTGTAPATGTQAASTGSQAAPAAPTLPPPPTETQQAESAELRTKHWRDGLVSLTAFLSETTIDMSAIHSLALDFVRQGFAAPEALVLRLEADQRSFIATHGVGPVFKRVRGDRAVRKDERTVFGIALSRRENVVIHNTSDPKITPYLPAWASAAGGWGSFIAIPLCDQTSCFSLMIVAWPQPSHIIIHPENAKLLRSLLATVAAARRLSQG